MRMTKKEFEKELEKELLSIRKELANIQNQLRVLGHRIAHLQRIEQVDPKHVKWALELMKKSIPKDLKNVSLTDERTLTNLVKKIVKS